MMLGKTTKIIIALASLALFGLCMIAFPGLREILSILIVVSALFALGIALFKTGGADTHSAIEKIVKVALIGTSVLAVVLVIILASYYMGF